MHIQEIIHTLLQKIERLEASVVTLEEENDLLKNKNNSNNSHIPPLQDQNRSRKNQSLRVPSDRKAGGQPGHEGTTLQCHVKVEETIKQSPVKLSICASNLSQSLEHSH